MVKTVPIEYHHNFLSKEASASNIGLLAEWASARPAAGRRFTSSLKAPALSSWVARPLDLPFGCCRTAPSPCRVLARRPVRVGQSAHSSLGAVEDFPCPREM